MKKIIILSLAALAAASDMDPKCFIKPPYVNPRTCCLDPTIVKDDLHEKCMRIVFKSPSNFPEDIMHEPNPEENTINPKADENSKSREKRSVDELQSPLDISSERNYKKKDVSDSSSSESSESSSEESIEELPRPPPPPHLYHRRQHGRHHHPRHHGRHHHGGHHHHHGRNGHHHGRNHHGRRHHGCHKKNNNRDDVSAHRYNEAYQSRNEYDDTYAPVFHRDFAKWTTESVRFQKLSIYWRCIFNETGIIDPDHKIIMSNVKSYLSDVLDDDNPFLPIMLDSFDACRIKNEEFIQNLINAREHYLLDSTPSERERYRKEHPYFNFNVGQFNQPHQAFFLIRCVKRMTYKNCPDEKFRTDDKLCVKSRAYLKNCPYSARQYYQRN